MESSHPFSVSFAPCFQGILCRSQLFFRMFLEKLFQICADRFIMKQKRRCFSPFLLSPSSRRAWIEIIPFSAHAPQSGSPSSRRAWIEIPRGGTVRRRGGVALLAEGVDRNAKKRTSITPIRMVALLAEGVDRNHHYRGLGKHPLESPSSRRAWIEIHGDGRCRTISHGRPPRGGRG